MNPNDIMKKHILLLSLLLSAGLVTTGHCQAASDNPNAVSSWVPAGISVTAQRADTSVQGAPASKGQADRPAENGDSDTRGSKKRAAAPRPAAPQIVRVERPLVTLEFVVNRGEVFSVNAPGDLTSLTLSGYQSGCDTLSLVRGMLNERASVNSMTLTGAARINDYSPEPSGHVTASLRLLPLVAAHGLTLTLTVDGRPMSVLLPFASEDCRWKGGTTYRYAVTVSGDRLLVTGMTVTADK